VTRDHNNAPPHKKTKARPRSCCWQRSPQPQALARSSPKIAQVKSGDPGYGYHVALAVGTVLLSWAFTHTIFALHYAYAFYREGQRAKGLKFPDDDKPDYWDFVYFSFVIGMTFQVSDVQVTNKGIRRLVTAHGVVSFLFNTTVIALTVNMATQAF
jgi:uncharacterized membrane protein